MLCLKDDIISEISRTSSSDSFWQVSKNCLKQGAVSVKFLSLSANSRMLRVKTAKSGFFRGSGDLTGEEWALEDFRGILISMSVRDCQTSGYDDWLDKLRLHAHEFRSSPTSRCLNNNS
jgi:hypothetical protein